MTPFRLSILAAAGLALAACGGSARDDQFRNAAPSTAALSIDVDAGAATLATAAATTASAADPAAMMPLPGGCHPFLFARTEAVARRLNRHFRRALDRIEHVIQRDPALQNDGQLVWTETRDGVDVRFTMTRAGDVFTWKLELKPAGAPDTAFATVFSGDIDRTGATAPHDGAGSFTLDLDALHAVTSLDVAGKLDAKFTLTQTKRLIDIQAAGVKWDPDADGDLARIAPLDASYTFLREPGVGGSLVLHDAMVFACPANPTLAPADATLVSRWFRTQSGEIHGRSDAKATGGQIPAGDTWMGVTCHARVADDQMMAPSEFFWLIKEEDANGATLQSWQVQGGTGACDPAFGPVPSATSNATDFDFSTIVTPFPFPGMF
jgi:hypothetical protein